MFFSSSIGPTDKRLRPLCNSVKQCNSDQRSIGDDSISSNTGISGKIFAALGESGINIRMINQGPDELNIIFGVDNKDFKEAIRVLYNSFITK